MKTLNSKFPTPNLKGFTVIELMIAIFLLVVGIVGVVVVFPIGLDIGKASHMSSVATQLCQAQNEDTIAKSYDEITVGTVTEEYGTISGFGAYKRVAAVNYVYVDANKVLYPEQSSPSDTGIKKIEVQVFWRSLFGGVEKNVKLSNLISRR